MAETVNQGNQNNPQNEKTFTQAQLDAIVAERLAREKERYADYETLKEKAGKFDAAEEASKTELQKATDKAAELQKQLDELKNQNKVRELREKVAGEMKVPANLLTADTEDALKAQAQAILEYARPGTYPQVRDGGEINPSGGTGGQNTAQIFKGWFDQNF